jgi:hypothetical protein
MRKLFINSYEGHLFSGLLSLFLAGNLYAVQAPAPKYKYPIVTVPWSVEAISKNYNKGQPIKRTLFDYTMNYLVFKSEFKWLIAEGLVSSGSDQTNIKKIGDLCSQKYNDTWVIIRCVSEEVNSFLAKTPWVNGFRQGTNISFCRAHAHTFKQVIKYLNLPHVSVEFEDASFESVSGKPFMHVVNQLYVRINEKLYSYIIDVGWFPGLLFPRSKSAKNFQEKFKNEPARQLPIED